MADVKPQNLLAAGLACVVVGACYFLQQKTTPPEEFPQFAKMYHKAVVDYGVIEPVLSSYPELSSNAPAIKDAVRTAWDSAQKGDDSAFMAILAMQNQQMIQQNARIIALLERNAKKQVEKI